MANSVGGRVNAAFLCGSFPKAVQVTVRLALIRGAVWGFRGGGSSAGVGEV